MSQKHGKRLAYNDLVNAVVCENTDFKQMVVLEYDHYCINIAIAYQQYNYKTGGPNNTPIGCPATHLKKAILFFVSNTGDEDSNTINLDSSLSPIAPNNSIDETVETTIAICVGTRFNHNDCSYDVVDVNETQISCCVHLPNRLRGTIDIFPLNGSTIHTAIANYSM